MGTGNLAGVAGALAIGGPGAIFWMWVAALLGMGIKFAEAALAVRYREKDRNGEYIGGPMYMIKNGLGSKWLPLAYIYCFFGVVASFGVGNATQINTVISGLDGVLISQGLELKLWLRILIGLCFALLLPLTLLKGAKRIGQVTAYLVPIASVGYMVLGGIVLLLNSHKIPVAFQSIIFGAFSPRAVSGGVVGSMFTAMRIGTSRGVYTNEAGMGTAAIAHAGGEVSHPAEQGLMGIIEVFIDTILICTMTALVILCSGVNVPYGIDCGVSLTANAFSVVFGDWVQLPLTAALCCFAVATVLGWGLYGVRCASFLFGENVLKKFILLQGLAAVLGAILQTGTIWLLTDIVNGLMAVPNLIALFLLLPELKSLLKSYKHKEKA